MSRILIADPCEPRLDSVLSVHPGAELVVADSGSEAELIALGQNVDALICSGIPVPAAVIQSMRRCKIVARTGSGMDKIDLAAADEEGILVTNTPNYCLSELSDHTIAFMLAFARKLFYFDADIRQGHWFLEESRPIRRLAGSTLGLIGFGKLARAVVPKARAFDLTIMAHDLYVSPAEIEREGVKAVSLDYLLKESDFISLHLPLIPETRHLIDRREFSLMKSSAVLINTSRGRVVNEEALIEALSEGKIAGAALDVLQREPPESGNPLLGMENVILTPHVAAFSLESIRDAWIQAAEEVKRVFSGDLPVALINPNAVVAFNRKWKKSADSTS